MSVVVARIVNDEIVNIIVAADDWQKNVPSNGQYVAMSTLTGVPRIGAVLQNDGTYYLPGTKPTTVAGQGGGGLPGCECTPTGISWVDAGTIVYTYGCLPTNGGACACNCPNSAPIYLGIF